MSAIYDHHVDGAPSLQAMYKCNIDDKYLAYHCAHGAGAGALAASLLMALGAAMVTLMSV